MQEFWNIFTDLIVVIALLTAAGFGLLAFLQWYRRKSFLAIDRELRWTLLPLTLLVATYIIFDKFLILSTRPNGSGEPSFPSTHTMLVATIFFLTIQLLPKYLKNRTALIVLDVLMLAAVVLVAVGRVLANMHWASDVLGGILFAAIFAVIYALILRYTTPKAKNAKDSKDSKNLKNSTPSQILPKSSR